MFNQRTEVAGPAEAKDIIFVFVGTFDPATLIKGPNSPFNVATSFFTTDWDFSPEQVAEAALQAGCPESGPEVFGWTHGHPYLTNRMLNLMLESLSTTDAAQAILRDDIHLRDSGSAISRIPV